MLLLRRATAGILVAVGGVLAFGNYWYTATRSTIPLPLHNQLVEKQKLLEKQRGVDDVHLFVFADGQTLHVDRAVYEAVRESVWLNKVAWSFDLHHDDGVFHLDWSRDCLGMQRVMPVAVVLMLFLSTFGNRCSQEDSASPGSQHERDLPHDTI